MEVIPFKTHDQLKRRGNQISAGLLGMKFDLNKGYTKKPKVKRAVLIVKKIWIGLQVIIADW
jgi:hypothetical protein